MLQNIGFITRTLRKAFRMFKKVYHVWDEDAIGAWQAPVLQLPVPWTEYEVQCRRRWDVGCQIGPTRPSWGSGKGKGGKGEGSEF